MTLFRKMRWWLQRQRKEDELREELQFHLAAEIDERRAAGSATPSTSAVASGACAAAPRRASPTVRSTTGYEKSAGQYEVESVMTPPRLHVIPEPTPSQQRRPGFLLAILPWDQGKCKTRAA